MQSPGQAGDLVQSLAPPKVSMWLGPLSPYGLRVSVYKTIEPDVMFFNILSNSVEQCIHRLAESLPPCLLLEENGPVSCSVDRKFISKEPRQNSESYRLVSSYSSPSILS